MDTLYNTFEEETTWRNALSWKNPTNTQEFTLLKIQPITNTKLWALKQFGHCTAAHQIAAYLAHRYLNTHFYYSFCLEKLRDQDWNKENTWH